MTKDELLQAVSGSAVERESHDMVVVQLDKAVYAEIRQIPWPVTEPTAAERTPLPESWIDRYGLDWRLHLEWTTKYGPPRWDYGYAAKGSAYELLSTQDLEVAVRDLRKQFESLKAKRGPERTDESQI